MGSPLKVNPDLMQFDMQEGFFAVANPLVNNGVRLLSRPQKDILEKIDGQRDINEIAASVNMPFSAVESTINRLNLINAVTDGDVFEIQQYEVNNKFLTLWIHITDRCNLKCSYCYIPTIRKPTDIQEETLDGLRNKLLELVDLYDIEKISLRLAGGEPFSKFSLWKDWVANLKEHFENSPCYLHVGCLTNMTIMNDEILEYVQKYKIGLGISLDGINDWHDKTRIYINGKPSFKTVSQNIKRLQSLGIGFNIMVVASNNNIGGLLEATKYFIEHNIPFRFSDVKGEDFNRQEFREVLSACYQEIETAIESGYEFSRLHSLCDLNFGMVSPNACSMGKNGAAIYVDGGIYFCHTQFGDKEPLGGVISKDDLFTTIRKGQELFLAEEKHEDCMKCRYRLVCASGCPVYRTEDNKSPECELFHSVIPRIFYLMAKERLYKVKRFAGAA